MEATFIRVRLFSENRKNLQSFKLSIGIVAS